MSALVLQVLTGLASASALFLVASGLSLIFGVTRIVNFAHGSFYMLGLYGAVALTDAWGAGPLGFWGGVVLSAIAVAALGALIEVLVLRRLYAAPELYQLLATFALVLVIRDAALRIWGPEDLLGPKAPALKGAIDILGKPFPSYDVLSIFIGPIVLGALWLLLKRTRWGLLVRAATQDREMVGALGVNQRWLFTSVFALGTFLAALGGALQMPHEPANLNLDLALIGEVFVVVVVGGMGSIGGAFVAAILIAMVKAFCIAAGTIDVFGAPFPLSKLTLVAEFLVNDERALIRRFDVQLGGALEAAAEQRRRSLADETRQLRQAIGAADGLNVLVEHLVGFGRTRCLLEEIVGRPVDRLAVHHIQARRDGGTIHLAMAGPAADDLSSAEVRRIDGVHHLNHLARGHFARSVRGIVRRMTLQAAHAQGSREQPHRAHEFIHGNALEHLDVLESLV